MRRNRFLFSFCVILCVAACGCAHNLRFHVADAVTGEAMSDVEVSVVRFTRFKSLLSRDERFTDAKGIARVSRVNERHHIGFRKDGYFTANARLNKSADVVVTSVIIDTETGTARRESQKQKRDEVVRVLLLPEAEFDKLLE